MVKRFYKENEMVWAVADKTKAKVLSLDVPNLSARISVKQEDGSIHEKTVKFMEIDKLKQKTNKSEKPTTIHNQNNKESHTKKDTILFAKVRENAVIPSKREEDGAYDVYCALEPNASGTYEMLLRKNEPNLVPTGLAMSLLSKYAFNMTNERGSTGSKGMLSVCGLVDSGYRNEIFVNIIPTWKDVLITSKVTEVKVLEDIILYPNSKAIAQGYVQYNLDLNVKEIAYEALLKIPSERGLGKIGSSKK